MAFADDSSKQYEDGIRKFYEIMLKLYQLENHGLNQAAKMYLNHDEEVAFPILKETSNFRRLGFPYTQHPQSFKIQLRSRCL